MDFQFQVSKTRFRYLKGQLKYFRMTRAHFCYFGTVLVQQMFCKKLGQVTPYLFGCPMSMNYSESK